MNCEWPACQSPATHAITVDYPDGRFEIWHVCSEHDKEVKKQIQRSIPLPQPVTSAAPTAEVTCLACSRTLPAGHVAPCPTCGSTRRLHKVGLNATLGFAGSIMARQKRPGRGRWLRRILSGRFFSTFNNSWTKRELDTDAASDTYRERLEHHDGTVVESRAKLSDHTGH
jgi:hypothetical protein